MENQNYLLSKICIYLCVNFTSKMGVFEPRVRRERVRKIEKDRKIRKQVRKRRHTKRNSSLEQRLHMSPVTRLIAPLNLTIMSMPN